MREIKIKDVAQECGHYNTYTDSYLSYQTYHKRKLQKEDQTEADASLQDQLDELKIKYDKQNKEDFEEMRQLLHDRLQYPSSRIAQIHTNANKIGPPTQFHGKVCTCCLRTQRLNNNYCSDDVIQRCSAHIQKCFQQYYHLALLLGVLFIIYGIFATVSNIITSQIYKSDSNGSLTDNSQKSYVMPLLFSFGSQQFYSINFARVAAYVQGWLAIIALLLWSMSFGISDEQAWRLELQFPKSKRIQDISLVCYNMPAQYLRNHQLLEEKIKNDVEIVKKHLNIDASNQKLKQFKIHDIVPTNIVEVQKKQWLSLENYIKTTQKIQKHKKILMGWIDERKKTQAFSVNKNQRLKNYEELFKLRIERHDRYEQVLREYQSQELKICLTKQNARVDAIVTFQSPLTRLIVMLTQQNMPKSSCFNPCKKQIEWGLAPTPEDVHWDNFNQGNCEKVSRLFVTVIVTVTVLSGSFFALYYFHKLKLDFSARNEQSKVSPILNSLVSILVSLPIYIVNFLIKTIFDYLSRNFEKNTTYSGMQARLAQKTVLVLLMNSVLIPVLVNMAYKENLYGIEGLASDVYYFALTNAILSTAMKLFNISFMINRLFAWYNNWTCNKKDTNQLELNRSCEYMPFQIGLEYAGMVSTFLYTSFFAPLQPIIILFGVIGLMGSKYASRVVLLSMSKTAVECNLETHSKMLRIVHFGPLLFAIGSFLWTDIYAVSLPRFRHTNIILFIISLVPVFFGGKNYMARLLNPRYFAQPDDQKLKKSLNEERYHQSAKQIIDPLYYMTEKRKKIPIFTYFPETSYDDFLYEDYYKNHTEAKRLQNILNCKAAQQIITDPSKAASIPNQHVIGCSPGPMPNKIIPPQKDCAQLTIVNLTRHKVVFLVPYDESYLDQYGEFLRVVESGFIFQTTIVTEKYFLRQISIGRQVKAEITIDNNKKFRARFLNSYQQQEGIKIKEIDTKSSYARVAHVVVFYQS